jgi:hypothetical protein
MFCEINPACNIIFNIVFNKLDEAISEYRLAVVHNKLLLEECFITFA